MVKYRVFYDNDKVIGIVPNDTSFTYTSHNVIVGDIKKIGIQLRTIGINTDMLIAYEANIEGGDKYQYIIIPTDLIPLLFDSINLVEDVLTEQEFTIYLSNIRLVQRDGTKKNVKTLPISFTPCTILDWEEGDETQLQAIINAFNSQYNPPRSIDFPCHFINLQALEEFKAIYCI